MPWKDAKWPVPARVKEHLILCCDIPNTNSFETLIMLLSPILFLLLSVMICAEAIAMANY